MVIYYSFQLPNSRLVLFWHLFALQLLIKAHQICWLGILLDPDRLCIIVILEDDEILRWFFVLMMQIHFILILLQDQTSVAVHQVIHSFETGLLEHPDFLEGLFVDIAESSILFGRVLVVLEGQHLVGRLVY